MKLNDEEFQTLADQLKEWNDQIDALLEKQRVMAKTAIKLAQELEELRMRCRIATQKLRKQEVGRSGCYYMWENIGDGG
jgi:septal ring factor EnvC (AmiA/AmiB activator)